MSLYPFYIIESNQVVRSHTSTSYNLYLPISDFMIYERRTISFSLYSLCRAWFFHTRSNFVLLLAKWVTEGAVKNGVCLNSSSRSHILWTSFCNYLQAAGIQSIQINNNPRGPAESCMQFSPSCGLFQPNFESESCLLCFFSSLFYTAWLDRTCIFGVLNFNFSDLWNWTIACSLDWHKPFGLVIY